MAESNGYVSPFIPDGYDTLVTIPALPGRWSAVQVRFRPLSKRDESLIWSKLRINPDAPKADFEAEVLAKKILGWDLKDPTGNQVPITPANLLQLDPTFYDTLLSYVDGTIKTATGETQVEADTKNSAPGSAGS